MSNIDWDTPEIAMRYDRNGDNQFRKGNMLIEMMGIGKGDNVLDIGCGTGKQAIYVAGIIENSGSLLGIDPSSHRIRLAREKCSPDISSYVRFMVGQAENLEKIPGNSINHAYFCSSFHWIDDKEVALSEVFRVLKSGGKVGMSTRDRSHQSSFTRTANTVLQKYGVETTTGFHHGQTKTVTADELHLMLSEAGFADITIIPKKIPWKYVDSSQPPKMSERVERILSGVPDNLKEAIKTELMEELPAISETGNSMSEQVSLFVTAKKPEN